MPAEITVNNSKISVTNSEPQISIEVERKKISVSPASTAISVNPTVNKIIVGAKGHPLTDDQVVELAESADATFSYTGTAITSINYTDYQGVTSNLKTLNYNGSDQLTSTVHSFIYRLKTWTVTTTYSYSVNQVTSRARTIVKV